MSVPRRPASGVHRPLIIQGHMLILRSIENKFPQDCDRSRKMCLFKCYTNDNLTSRVIPGLKSKYRIVSLPFWAWFWLDDFMQQNRISYQGMLETFGCNGDINNTLKNIAELHQDHCMRSVHKLSNDNTFLEHKDLSTLTTKKIKPKNLDTMPKIYKLFGFMPCATTLDAVWARKNYDEHNQVN